MMSKSTCATFFACLIGVAALFLNPEIARSDDAGFRPSGKPLLLLVGSNTLGERAAPELAKAYLEQHKNAQSVSITRRGEVFYVTGRLPAGSVTYIEIHATGSGDCFKSFLGSYRQATAPCDIGLSSRPVTEEEAHAIKDKLGCDFFRRGTESGQGCEHPVAMDGVAIVVPKSNPLTRISVSELRAIYSRQTVDWNQMAEWSAVGGSGEVVHISPMRRKEPSGTLDFFKERVRPAAGPMNDTKVIPAFTSSEDLAAKVAETPGGIAFVGQSYALLPGLKRLQVYDDSKQMMMAPDEAVFPDPAAVRKQLYPLSRVLYLYTSSFSLNSEVQPFIQFALGEEGQTIVADKGNLCKIEGTQYAITKSAAPASDSTPHDQVTAGKKKNVILRIHGSNTIGAECAVDLAYNFLAIRKLKSNPNARIEDDTSALETPEGEQTLAHEVKCDTHGDGVLETIEILPTGSSDAFRDLGQGRCDIGMASRAITDAETRDLLSICGRMDTPDAQYALGLDALAVIVSKDNPINRLTIEQLRRLFWGEIVNWSEVGGQNQPIQLHARPERSGTYQFFRDSVLLGKSTAASAKRHAENSFLAEVVAKDRTGIGITPMTATGPAKVLQIGQEGSETYSTPSEDSVRAGKYPVVLCRYVYLYVPPAAPKNADAAARLRWQTARDFADLSQNWRGQAIVANCGFVTETVAADEAGQTRRLPSEALAAYVQRLGEIEKKASSQQLKMRPKLTNGEICSRLLFEPNEWVLTPESRNIIDRQLGPWLKMFPAIAKSGLIAEGWSDSGGSDAAAMKVSLQRAQNVAQYVSDSLHCPVMPVGKGKSEDPPNTSEANKQENRRVVIRCGVLPAVASVNGTEAPAKSASKNTKTR